MFASSREGEEADSCARSPGHPGVQWLLVPRHPQRFDEVAALVAQAGLHGSRRSAWSDAPRPADVWIGDSLGEMALYYALADVALLGGSFAPLGGQNLIEAAACGCPVVMGPHTFNFAEAAQLAQGAGAALRVARWKRACGRRLARDAHAASSAVRACRAFRRRAPRRGARRRPRPCWALRPAAGGSSSP